jgi:hypothetical protein
MPDNEGLDLKTLATTQTSNQVLRLVERGEQSTESGVETNFNLMLDAMVRNQEISASLADVLRTLT